LKLSPVYFQLFSTSFKLSKPRLPFKIPLIISVNLQNSNSCNPPHSHHTGTTPSSPKEIENKWNVYGNKLINDSSHFFSEKHSEEKST
jgi:hypothetical protein